tara:strand:- start:704 stop:1234 length:531 start_codon:yes stop_codon:yes gene_type:complete
MLSLSLLHRFGNVAKSQTIYIMSKDINIKDCRKAVNQAKYNPTAERKANAVRLLQELMEAVSLLPEPKVAPKPKAKAKAKPKAKAKSKANVLARKASAGRPKTSNEKLERQQAKDNVSTTYLKPKAEKSYQAPRKEVYTLSEGESVEMAMAKLRTKRLADAEALAIAEFEESIAPF